VTRHLVAGRIGVDDTSVVPAADDEVATRLDLVASQKLLDYGIGRALSDLKKLKVFPTEIGVDLLILAAHVHAADTRISRTTQSQDSWTREIRLVVPVSDVQRWNANASTLQRALNFLTGDRWSLGFRPRPPRFTAIAPQPRTDLLGPPFDAISLFSGGLDSMIGAIDILHVGGVPLLISHAGEGAVSKSQDDCYDVLKSHYKNRPFDRLRVWMNFPQTLVRGADTENTTRGRSFLFFAIGIFASAGLRRPFTLNVPENGLIALNVPLDPLRLGALSTRTTHPFYIARWNELLAGLGIPGQIRNPYWSQTKGEMVAACANPALLNQAISQTLSCSSPTKARWVRRGTEHCGFCVPCVIRRAALQSINDPTRYTLSDLRARTLNSNKAEGEQIRSFQYAIARLRARPALARSLIFKPGSLSDNPANIPALSEVYRRGLEEVGTLLTGVRTEPS
jgi:hypothetical protein